MKSTVLGLTLLLAAICPAIHGYIPAPGDKKSTAISLLSGASIYPHQTKEFRRLSLPGARATLSAPPVGPDQARLRLLSEPFATRDRHRQRPGVLSL